MDVCIRRSGCGLGHEVRDIYSHWRTYDQVTPSLSLVTTVHLHSLLHPTGCTQTHIRVERLGKETCCWLLKGRQHLIFLCCVGRSTKKPRQLQLWWWKKRGTDTRALARLQTQDDATKNRGKPGSSFLAIYHISSCLSCTSKEIACKLVCAHFSFARASLWSCPSACRRDRHRTCTILHGARARVVPYGIHWRNWSFSRSSFAEHCQDMVYSRITWSHSQCLLTWRILVPKQV
jgi:hypothetical protein